MKPFILRSNSGFFDIYDKGKIIRTKPRGKLRSLKIKPVVGDEVIYSDSTLIDIIPRTNFLNRPPLANIDQAIVIASFSNPKISIPQINRYILSLTMQNIKPILFFSKNDLTTKDDSLNLINYYKSLGYSAYSYTIKQELSEEIISLFKNKKSALIGQSGVGKSSLLNRLFPDFNRETNEVSASLGRGKHTTRIVEFLPFLDGFVADTPGFSFIDINLSPTELATLYPGFENYIGKCRFVNCLHQKEVGCAIIEDVSKGIIDIQHYQDYLKLLQERKEKGGKY